MSELKVVRAIIGFALLGAAAAVLGRSTGYDAFLFVPLAAALGLLAGVFLHPLVSGPVGALAGRLFYPEGGAEPPEQFTRVHALLAERDYTAAETELRVMLDARPELESGYTLLATVLYENLDRPDEALTLARNRLGAGKWKPEHEKLALLAADILLDRGERAAARELLQRAARRAGRNPAAARLTERAAHLAEPESSRSC